MNIIDENGLLYRKSLVNQGDPLRIKKVMKKALQGEKIVLGYFGGSITQGAVASSWGKNYTSLTTGWWRSKFPNAEIIHVNAGIGATGSIIGLHRAHTDLLKLEPDLIIVDFAVNDYLDEPLILSDVFESLIRMLLYSKKDPGVVLLFLTRKDGGNTQNIHAKTGFYYDLPMISFRDAMWPELTEGRIQWEDIEGDEVHPNDCGHYLLYKFLTDRLEEIYRNPDIETDNCLPFERKKPLALNSYNDASILYSNQIEPISMGDWDIARNTLVFGPGWIARGCERPLIMDVNARSIGIIYKRKNTGEMGRVEIKVDGIVTAILDGHIPPSWGEHAYGEIVAGNLSEGRHRIEIRLCEKSHSESRGREFMISGVMITR